MINITGKSILICVDGSHAIGLGHIYRMKSLALSLQKAGSNVAFLTKKDKTANNLLKTTGLSCHLFQSDSYDSALKEAIKKEQPVLIIKDILETSFESMKRLRRLSSAKIINFDDVGAGLSMADALINGMVFCWNKYGQSDIQTRVLEGPRYAILQPEASLYVHMNKKIPEKAKNIMLVFGGTDTHYVTERVLEAINTTDAELNIRINLGPGTQGTSRLEQAIKVSGHHVEVIRFAPSLLLEFFRSDLVVCGGGLMLYELAALGVPSISIATEPHEVDNVHYWSETGTTVSLGWEKILNMTQVSETVNRVVCDREQRAKMSEIGKQTVDDQGLGRVLKIIEEILS